MLLLYSIIIGYWYINMYSTDLIVLAEEQQFCSNNNNSVLLAGDGQCCCQMYSLIHAGHTEVEMVKG